MTYYRRGKPQFEEPVHWEWFNELVRAGILVPAKVDVDEIVRELAGCVLHGSWDTGCDFDYAEAKAIILRDFHDRPDDINAINP